ncbi:hypothetical protein N9C27_03230 [Luminiphilus sp.]|nr:hypothetical protein [Luminiphilus sp.]
MRIDLKIIHIFSINSWQNVCGKKGPCMHPMTVKISRYLCFVWLMIMLAIVAIITTDLGPDRWLRSLWIGQFVVTCIWGALYLRRAVRVVMSGVAAKKDAMAELKSRA